MRWDSDSVQLNPSLNAEIGGIVLHDVQWRGRTFTVDIGQRRTTVTLESGAPMPVSTPTGVRTVTQGQSLTLATRRPDLAPSSDLVRCGAATASSAQPGAPALAGVDGSPATDWEPTSVNSTLTAPIASPGLPINTVTLRWGQQWPPAPAPNVPPPPGPVTVLRPASYSVLVSNNGRTWRQVASVSGHDGQVLDTLHLSGVRARFIRVALTATSTTSLPMLDELTATR